MANNLYVVVYPDSATDPADDAGGRAQIVAGQNGDGGAATYASGAVAWTGSGQQISASGLSANIWYRSAAVVYDGASAYSNSVLSNAFFALTCSVGNSAATGQPSVISLSAGIEIACGVGNAIAVGILSGINARLNLACATGNAAASGTNASIEIATGIVISCAVGNATAIGIAAAINSRSAIACNVGSATAAGIASVANLTSTLDTSPGAATAAGILADLSLSIVVPATQGAAVASGVIATIAQAGIIWIDCFIANADCLGVEAGLAVTEIYEPILAQIGYAKRSNRQRYGYGIGTPVHTRGQNISRGGR